MTVDRVLSRLQVVRKGAGPGTWTARCPAHEDRSPSLSIRELDDGRMLVHCFGGCDVSAIVGAVGLDLTDLFPGKPTPGGGRSPMRRRRMLTAQQALQVLYDEANLIWLCAANQAAGVVLTDGDRARLTTAAGRVLYLRDEVMA
jgi:hypothetical protein